MKLPPLIFLVGPHGAGKTTLANLLCDRNNMIAHCSFDEPIREMTLQGFFPDQLHQGIDLREDDVLSQNLPFSSVTIAYWMANLRRTMRDLNPCMLGDLAKKRLGFFQNQFEHFLFDDAEMPDDIKPFANAWGAHNCRIIFVERQGKPIVPYLRRFDHTFIPRLLLTNVEGKPGDMLTRLDQMMPSDLDHPKPEVPAYIPPAEPPSAPETSIGDL